MYILTDVAYTGPLRESMRPETTVKRAEVAASRKGGEGMGKKIRWRENTVELGTGEQDVALLGNEKQMKIGKQRSKEH